MSDIFPRGHKCMFKGQPILGDGEHTREELYLKVMAGKQKPKRGAPKVTEPATIPDTKIDTQKCNLASQEEAEKLPKSKPKKKAKK